MGYSKPKFKDQYENYINGEFVSPVGGMYFENTSPIDNTFIAKYPRSQKEDVDNAVAAANAAKHSAGFIRTVSLKKESGSTRYARFP